MPNARDPIIYMLAATAGEAVSSLLNYFCMHTSSIM